MTVADTDLAAAAVSELERALREPPTQLKEQVDVAERAIACLRDHLIERLRARPDAAAAARWRAALSRTNIALSLVVGVEYPADGLQREPLQAAADQLREAIDYLR